VWTALIAAVGVLALLTVIPGPDVAVVTRVTIGSGRGGGNRAGIGIACGLLVWGGLAVAGLAAVLAAYSAIVHRAGGTLRRPRVRQWTERVTSVVLLGFGAKVAASRG
jgi:threonine/homoserine/homoserine lactone efflux protein